MKKSLFALALTLTLVAPMAGHALAITPLVDDVTVQGATTDDNSPVLGSDAKVDESYNKTDVDTDVDVKNSLNKTVDVTKTENTDSHDTSSTDSFNKTVDVTKTDTDSHDTSSTDSFNKTVDVTKTDVDVKVKDSFNTDSSTKTVAVSKTETDSHDKTVSDSFNTKTVDASKTTEGSFNKTVDITKTDTDSHDKTVDITKAEDSYNKVSSKGDLSPAMYDSKIDDSNLGTLKAAGEGLNTNLQGSKIDDSNFVNGDQDNSVQYTQDGQLNAADSKVEVGNLAGHDSTIFDGDVSFGGGYGLGESLVPSLGGAGDVNVNTGVATDSVLGNDSQISNGGGIAINGTDLGGGFKAPGSSVSLNNTQSINQNVIGGQ